MYQATTPIFKFTVPFEVSNVVDLRLTFSQQNNTVLDLGFNDVTFSEPSTIIVRFTQQQASLFKPDITSEVQLRVKFADGSVAASKYVKMKVNKALNLEVM